MVTSFTTLSLIFNFRKQLQPYLWSWGDSCQMGNKQQKKHIFCCKLHWFHILFNMIMTMTMLYYSQRAQTGVWAPFDLFSSFSATTSFGFGFAVGGVVGSASGTFVTSVSGSFTRVSHCQSWTALLIHPFIQRGVKNALKINIYLWFDDRIDIASRALISQICSK